MTDTTSTGLFSGKQKALVAGIITFVLGLVGAVTPFITDASWVKAIAVIVAVLSFVSTTVGVYQTKNKV